MVKLRNFVSKLGKYSDVVNQIDFNELAKAIKTVEIPNIKSAEDVFKNVSIERNAKTGVLNVGNAGNKVTIGKFEKLIKIGDLKALAKLSNKIPLITDADAALFKKLTKDFNTPDFKLSELDDLIVINKKKFPELNAKSIESLSKEGKASFNKVISNIGKIVKVGQTVALTIGVITIGTKWYLDALEKRKGCWLVTINSVTGKATSCKIKDYSCTNPKTDEASECAQNKYNTYYNTTLILMALCELKNDDILKLEAARVVNVEVETFVPEKIEFIIENCYEIFGTYLDTLTDKEKKQKFIDLVNNKECKIKNDKWENGVIPECRMCDTSADPTSTMFLSPKFFADNITVQCVNDVSIIDLFSDIGNTLGNVIFEGLSGLGSFFKKIALYAVILFIIIVIIFFGYKFYENKKTTTIGYTRLDDSSREEE